MTPAISDRDPRVVDVEQRRLDREAEEGEERERDETAQPLDRPPTRTRCRRAGGLRGAADAQDVAADRRRQHVADELTRRGSGRAASAAGRGTSNTASTRCQRQAESTKPPRVNSRRAGEPQGVEGRGGRGTSLARSDLPTRAPPAARRSRWPAGEGPNGPAPSLGYDPTLRRHPVATSLRARGREPPGRNGGSVDRTAASLTRGLRAPVHRRRGRTRGGRGRPAAAPAACTASAAPRRTSPSTSTRWPRRATRGDGRPPRPRSRATRRRTRPPTRSIAHVGDTAGGRGASAPTGSALLGHSMGGMVVRRIVADASGAGRRADPHGHVARARSPIDGELLESRRGVALERGDGGAEASCSTFHPLGNAGLRASCSRSGPATRSSTTASGSGCRRSCGPTIVPRDPATRTTAAPRSPAIALPDTGDGGRAGRAVPRHVARDGRGHPGRAARGHCRRRPLPPVREPGGVARRRAGFLDASCVPPAA